MPTDLKVHAALGDPAILMADTKLWDGSLRVDASAGRLAQTDEQGTDRCMGALAAAAGPADGGVTQGGI